MPAITICGPLTTRPFASDDMHIVCMILSVYRAVQFICLFPLAISFYLESVKGKGLIVNGVPSWCSQSEYIKFNSTYENCDFPVFKEVAQFDYHSSDYFAYDFMGFAVGYLMIDVAWLCMVWRSASIGTPTEPMKRDKYIRNLTKFKMFLSNLYPLIMLGAGIFYVSSLRSNNYGCGDGEALEKHDEGAFYGLFCTLLVTYALELLVFPAIITNKFVRILKINMFWDRSRVEGRGGKAERFERRLGCMLKMLSCISKGKAGGKELKSNGELKDFAWHAMCLLNNETKLDLVLTDIYVGMRMLSLIQAEKQVDAIKKMALKSKFRLKTLKRSSDLEHEFNGRQPAEDKQDENNSAPRVGRRSSIQVLQMKQGVYEVCECEILQKSNSFDQTTIVDAAHFVKYASYIYVELPNYVIGEFVEGEEECSGFTRDLDTLFLDQFRLGSIGLEHSNLCYANFVNGIVATPYAILVDEEKKKIVLTVRGTRSLEDLVVDVQFIPESLEKVGTICGFDGEGRYCHKGFLARSKWMYNDIKKSKVLKTLYSQHSPYKDYPLILTGHSLGAGCAAILSLMLRPSFPSLMCYAFEPPGCIFDDKQCELGEAFITSFVRHDDLVPRLSYHNLETLRDGFLDAFARIKVPKIELFSHLRVPYSARFVALRNAKVLRHHEDIPTTTKFNEKLELLRAERAEKNSKGVNRVRLFIPGKIVHLVDTNGDGNYIPYWAGKREFNELVISKRMYADHDIHSLVKILGDIRLGEENTASLAFHNAPLIYDYDDDERDSSETDIRLFACCSNPYGRLPIILSLLGLIANVLSAAAAADCDFVRVSHNTTTCAQQIGTLDITFGIFAYGLRHCDGDSCDNIEDYAETCAPYPLNWTADQYMTASRVFVALAGLLGGTAIFMTYISMCYIYRPKVWKAITALLLLATLFQGLVFIFRRELPPCKELNATCSIGPGAIKMIVACCLWFLMAIGSGYLAKVGKKNQLAGDGGREDENESR